MIRRMDQIHKLTSEARKEEARLKIRWERMQDDIGRLMNRLRMEFVSDEEFQMTARNLANTAGVPFEEFAKDYLRERMEADDRYKEQMSQFYDLQEDYYMKTVRHQELAEELGMVKNQALLLSAMLRYASADGGASE